MIGGNFDDINLSYEKKQDLSVKSQTGRCVLIREKASVAHMPTIYLICIIQGIY